MTLILGAADQKISHTGSISTTSENECLSYVGMPYYWALKGTKGYINQMIHSRFLFIR